MDDKWTSSNKNAFLLALPKASINQPALQQLLEVNIVSTSGAKWIVRGSVRQVILTRLLSNKQMASATARIETDR